MSTRCLLIPVLPAFTYNIVSFFSHVVMPSPNAFVQANGAWFVINWYYYHVSRAFYSACGPGSHRTCCFSVALVQVNTASFAQGSQRTSFHYQSYYTPWLNAFPMAGAAGSVFNFTGTMVRVP